MIKCVMLNAHCTLIAEVVEVDAEIGDPNCKLIKPYVYNSIDDMVPWKADIDYNSWNLPKIFQDIMLAGEIPEEEMKKVFNLGIGYCIVIPEDSERDAHDTIDAFGYKSWTIGKVVL